MKINQIKKFPPLIIPFLALGAAALLTACGGQAIPLAGVAGTQGANDPATPASLPTEAPVNTPVPGTSGHIVFVSNRDGQKNLYVASPDGIEVTRVAENVSEGATARISPDGTRIAFESMVNNNMDIYILELASGAVTRVTDAVEKDSAPTWSPDSGRIAFVSFRDGNFEIYSANADGSNQIRLTNDPSGDSHPVWSPVTDEIVFVTGRFGNSDLMLVNLNGSVSTLTTSPSADNAPAWSPDGRMIAFQSFVPSSNTSNLCLIGRDALDQTCITAIPENYGAPIWSPNGQWIAASVEQSSGSGIHLFNTIDGSTQQVYAQGIEPRGAPAWSPEGLRLVFQALVNEDMELFSVLLPTSEITQLTSSPGYDGEPVWSVK